MTTDLQAFGLIVTAEPYFAVTKPSDVVDRQRDKKRHGRKNRGNRREVCVAERAPTGRQMNRRVELVVSRIG